jgi:ribosome-binding protein aMBF1 (putative translation factor)
MEVLRVADKDFLDAFIARRSARNLEFPALVAAAEERRRLARRLATRRKQLGLSQKAVAERMKTSQPAVARLEKGVSDVKISSYERYAAAVGLTLTHSLTSAPRKAKRDLQLR